MKKYIFGYGSLINLESASRTLKRNLVKSDVSVAILNNYERNWLLWDSVFSSELEIEVKGVFLNISYKEGKYLNGIVIELNDIELEYFKIREKNYDCVNVTDLINFKFKEKGEEYEVFTFVGKKGFLLDESTSNSYVFKKYIEIVTTGIQNFGKKFYEEYNITTVINSVPELGGTYVFVDNSQQKVR